MPAKQTASSVKSQDAIALLIADHKKVQKMFKDFEKLEDEKEKHQLVTEACTGSRSTRRSRRKFSTRPRVKRSKR